MPAGQRLSVIGSNGAGKTTFVNMVTGYLKPDGGEIRSRIATMQRSHRRIAGLGICRSFQIPQLCLEMTVLENLLAVAAANNRLSVVRGRTRTSVACRSLLRRFGLESTPNGRWPNWPAACASCSTSRWRWLAARNC